MTEIKKPMITNNEQVKEAIAKAKATITQLKIGVKQYNNKITFLTTEVSILEEAMKEANKHETFK